MGGITSFAWNWLFFLYKIFCIYIFGCVVFFYQLFRTETSLFPWRRPTGLQLSVSNFPFSLFLFFASSLEKWSTISSSCREIFLYFCARMFCFSFNLSHEILKKKRERKKSTCEIASIVIAGSQASTPSTTSSSQRATAAASLEALASAYTAGIQQFTTGANEEEEQIDHFSFKTTSFPNLFLDANDVICIFSFP